MANDGEAGSCPRRVRHLPNDHCGQVARVRGIGWAAPYLARWFPSGPIGAHSPVVNGLHVHAIQPFVLPALPA